ncbi:MAG: hypothetical protein AAFX01_05250 [Cyanobacteria bacterium J06638_28]
MASSFNNRPQPWLQLPGYTCVEAIYQGSRTIIYRAVQTENQSSVVIKVLRREYSSFSELVQADYYALGVTLYQLLIGSLLLGANGALEFVSSALGLKHDWEACLPLWECQAAVVDFELRQPGVCDRRFIFEQCYGWEGRFKPC